MATDSAAQMQFPWKSNMHKHCELLWVQSFTAYFKLRLQCNKKMLHTPELWATEHITHLGKLQRKYGAYGCWVPSLLCYQEGKQLNNTFFFFLGFKTSF